METLTRLLYPQERHSLVGSVQHPKFRLSLLTARPFYSAGGKFSGTLKIQCKSENLRFRHLKVELVGFEEITRPNFLQRDPKRRSFAKFRHAISDSQHLLSKVAEPDVEGFFEADRGEYSVPFEMQLSMKLPSSTESDRVKRHVSVRYLAIATVELKLPDGHLFTVTKSHPVTIYEKLQIHPELRAKLIETPQSAEVFHTFPGSSTPVHFGILIAKTLWVSGSLLTAQVTLRNSPKRRVSKVQLELIEVANSYRNFNSLDDEEIDEGIEDDNYSEGSTTLLDADLSHAAFSSSDASSLDTFSRVASKNALGRNAMPSQIDFENKERIWNLQLMVPLDSHTVQRTRFSSITHRVRASIGFYLAKQIYVELPVFIAHPLALNTDPYQSIRDGVLTNSHGFVGQNYRVYEQSMLRLGQHSNSTLNAEQHAFKQLDDLPSNLPSVGAAGDTLFNSPILQHFSSDINPSEDHVSPEISSPEISLGLPNEETLMSRQSTGHTVSTAPNSPHEVAVVTRPALHRRVRSEACKNDYFFQTASSGELPQINTNWDWFEKRFDKLEAASITPLKKDRGTAPILAQKSLRVHGTVPDGAQHSLTKLDLADDPSSKYTVKFPVDPRTKFPWRNQSILNRRRAISLQTAPIPVEDLVKIPAPKPEISAPQALSTNGSNSTDSSSETSPPSHARHSRPRPRYHPEVLARKYSFPPKTAEQKPKASASPRPPPSQPLKSALVKHKRAHTYGGSGKVRFAMDFDLEFTPSLHPDADQKVDTDHGLFIPSDKILTYARAPPFPNQVRVLCPEVEPPLPTSLLLSNTTSESSCTASSFMFSAEEDSLNSPELAQSVLSDDSGLFEASLASPGPFDPTRTSGFSSKSSSPLKKTVYKDQNVSASLALPHIPSPKVLVVFSPRSRARWKESFKWRSKAALASPKRLLTPPSYPSTLIRRTVGWEDIEGEEWSSLPNTSQASLSCPNSKPKQD